MQGIQQRPCDYSYLYKVSADLMAGRDEIIIIIIIIISTSELRNNKCGYYSMVMLTLNIGDRMVIGVGRTVPAPPTLAPHMTNSDAELAQTLLSLTK